MNIPTFLEDYRRIIEEQIYVISNLLNDINIKKITEEYRVLKYSHREEPFNVFKLASDLYYRENFHSDIMKAFLDLNENHKEGNLFLYAFIEFINIHYPKVCISKINYKNVITERESGRIDILIRSEESRHCIIIENKINNAGDTYRQLPKYYDLMTNQGYIVDAIIYIPLNENKKPDQSTWNENDMRHINPLLCIVPACDAKHNLVDNWIYKCSLLSRNIDCVLILRQYGELIKLLKIKNMSNILLEKFYQTLISNPENLNTVLSIRDMLPNLPVYMADRLVEKFKEDEGVYFVWKYKSNFCGVYFEINRIQYKIDIWTSENGYAIYVFGQDQNNNGARTLGWAEEIPSLQKYEFKRIDDLEYRKLNFNFYQEKDVIECVQEIISDIRTYILRLKDE